jgi:hypothetical protein
VPEKTEKADKPAVAAEPTEVETPYVSDQLAVKTWSIIARFLHEGAGIVMLEKAWDSRNSELIIFPSYAGQDPEALKPDVWTAWRHELKPPLGGHVYIRDYARVLDAIPIQSPGALRLVDGESALNLAEAVRRFESETPGLVALVLQVYHLPRAYKFYDAAAKEGAGQRVPLPYDVATEGSTRVLSDAELEMRRSALLRALGRD